MLRPILVGTPLLATTASLRLVLILSALLGFAMVPDLAHAQGPLTNGAVHSGAITAGETDTWTFSATIGDSITLNIGEVEPTVGFWGWIRLFSPSATLLANSYGDLAAQLNNVVAPATGTYTVLVSAYSTVPSGTGGYVLTLAKLPGALTVSSGDQGGPLTNGVNHTGQIPLGDLDAWTVEATAGESLTFNIGSVEPTVGFWPWIRLFGPTGTLLANTYGDLAAQINTITAPATGTYTVLVGSYSTAPAGTGGYVLTMAKVPGAFSVSAADEGGPVTIATGHPGAITLGDLDRWTFLAAEGDALAINIGEAEPTSGFWPWIRLLGPTGTVVGSVYGAVAAQINAVAPQTGLYTVLVASYLTVPAGTGNYVLTVTGVTTLNPLSEIAIDFGPDYGLWLRYNNGGLPPQTPYWQQLHGLSPSVMSTGKIDANGNDDLIATFPGYGVWMWLNSASWVQLHAFDATEIVTIDLDGNGVDEVVLNFPGYGLYVRWDTGTWTQLHNRNSAGMAVGRIDLGVREDLVINFPGVGVWVYLNNATWALMHGLNATDIQVGNLDGNTQDDVILNFPGYGVWVRFNNSSWYNLHSLASAGLAAGNIDDDAGNRQDLIINFPGFGVWAYMNNSTWVQLHSFNSPLLETMDLDFNGRDDVILNFPGYGLWLFMNNVGFVQLHGLDPEAFVTGRIDNY